MMRLIYTKINKELIHLRNRLKELRARDGYNQTQLAKLAGISRQTVSLIERKDFTPSVLTALKIAKIFNEPVENIFIIEEEDL
mgnify:CR=1 FL=1